MDAGTATVLAAACTSFAAVSVSLIGAVTSWRTSDTRAENVQLKARIAELEKTDQSGG